MILIQQIKTNADFFWLSNTRFNVPNFHPTIMKHATNIAILVSLLTAGSLHAKWGRIPVMREKPINLAVRGSPTGTSVDSSSGIGQVDSLLGADVTAPAALSAGKSFFVISFAKPVMINTSSLANDGIEGKITLSASADKQGWAVLQEKVVSAADRDIQFKFAGIQAKFLKFEFLLSKGGSIRALQVMGGVTDHGYALKQDPKGEKGQPMNFIGGLGGARLIYAAPKPVNGIDTAANFNKFEFPESDEKYRTLIYDFGQVRVLNEFSSVHSPSPVRFEVFSFEKLPEKEDWRGRLAFNPDDFNAKTPVVAVEDNIGTGHINAKPANPVKTRYLALRWEPDFNPPAFLVDSVGGKGNVMQIQGPTATTVKIGNNTVTVTVSPGDAIGAGSSEGNGTVTVAITAPDGTVTTTTYTNVTGATITPTGVQVTSGPDPATAAALDGSQQVIVGEAVINNETGAVSMVTSTDATSTTGAGASTTTTTNGVTESSAGGTTSDSLGTSATPSGSPSGFSTPGQTATAPQVTSP